MPKKKYGVLPLFFPIFMELLFSMLTGAVDTLMLATEGDQAVGAVGTANTYIGVFLILFSVLSSGMMAVMTQYIGANRPGVARQALRLGLLFNMSIGLVISAVLFFFASPILQAVGIADDLLEPAVVYLRTVGLFCLCNALVPIFSSYLRAFGHAKSTLSATIAANLVNVALNAWFLFGLHWGVLGVALATGISRLTQLVWVWAASRRHISVKTEENLPSNRMILRKIVQVGLPAAIETSLYNLAISMVISMLNRMDTTGMQVTARAYATQINNFAYCAAAALAQANAIIVGWRIGACQIEACDRDTRRNALVGIALGVGTAGVLALFAKPILGIFTQDPEMIRLVSILLVVDIFLELGRTTNLVFGFALKTSGDAVFPMITAIIFMFLCAAGGTWLFGIRLGWLAVGAYVGMALDELIRAVLMFLRWRSGKWKQKGLLSGS